MYSWQTHQEKSNILRISTYNNYLDRIENNLVVRAYRFFLEKKSPVIRYNEWLADCKTYRISNRWSIASMYEILCLLYTVWPRFSGILHIQCRFFSIIKIIAFVWADISLNVKLWMLLFFHFVFSHETFKIFTFVNSRKSTDVM